ncbi:MAG: GNAT family N-acetyltransferase [Oscillospiraceae bacterium]|nr:GNAT family N-acetyltransferase [Oscillospiraceae bacterium]
MKITLVRPRREDKEKVMDYKREFLAYGDQLHGTSMLDDYDVYEEWYTDTMNNTSEETVAEGWVTATTLLAMDENDRLVGMINIRHRLNDYLLRYGGHIGYSVRPTTRRQGAATQMLTQALEICRQLGIEKRLVTCDKNNTGSAATIRKCGGVLENEVYDGDVMTQRYWITL